MSDPHIDPAGNTQQFRAFAQRNERESAKQPTSYTVPIIIGVVVVAILAVVGFLLLG